MLLVLLVCSAEASSGLAASGRRACRTAAQFRDRKRGGGDRVPQADVTFAHVIHLCMLGLFLLYHPAPVVKYNVRSPRCCGLH